MDKQKLYDIYWSCRLCGANTGYKMPIIQNVVKFNDGIELQEKIKECLNIQVQEGDHMPPLICELCFDKVHEFYDFLKVCAQTNESTRMRLGLPVQVASKNQTNGRVLDQTESLLSNEDSDGEPLAKCLKTNKLRAHADQPEIKPKVDKNASLHKTEAQTGRNNSLKLTRLKQVEPPQQEEVPLLKGTRRSVLDAKTSELAVKTETIIKKDESVRAPKRMNRELENLLGLPPTKKAKIVESPMRLPSKPATQTKSLTKQANPQLKSNPSPKPSPASKPSPSPKPSPPSKTNTTRSNPPKPKLPPVKPNILKNSKPKLTNNTLKQANVPVNETNAPEASTPTTQNKPSKNQKKPPVKPPPSNVQTGKVRNLKCDVCKHNSKNLRGYMDHLKKHSVRYTALTRACNACREWFVEFTEAYQHHKEHRLKQIPYRCMTCSKEYKTIEDYELHVTRHECRTSTEVPDEKCHRCWLYFPTKSLLNSHQCQGESSRPAMCIICKCMVSAKNLKRHESTCKPKKGVLESCLVEQEVLDRLKPMQVRVARCDPLLKTVVQGHFDVSSVKIPYGLDRYYVYPYVSEPRTLIEMDTTAEPSSEAVANDDDVEPDIDYVHWDSDDEPYGVKEVESLTCMCLKVIYSPKLLGKVRKKRKVELNDEESSLRSIFSRSKKSASSPRKKCKSLSCRKKSHPKLSIIDTFSNLSLDYKEGYNSDSIISETFKGFDPKDEEKEPVFSRLQEEPGSEDSQSLIFNMRNLPTQDFDEDKVLLNNLSNEEFNCETNMSKGVKSPDTMNVIEETKMCKAIVETIDEVIKDSKLVKISNSNLTDDVIVDDIEKRDINAVSNNLGDVSAEIVEGNRENSRNNYLTVLKVNEINSFVADLGQKQCDSRTSCITSEGHDLSDSKGTTVIASNENSIGCDLNTNNNVSDHNLGNGDENEATKTLNDSAKILGGNAEESRSNAVNVDANSVASNDCINSSDNIFKDVTDVSQVSDGLCTGDSVKTIDNDVNNSDCVSNISSGGFSDTIDDSIENSINVSKCEIDIDESSNVLLDITKDETIAAGRNISKSDFQTNNEDVFKIINDNIALINNIQETEDNIRVDVGSSVNNRSVSSLSSVKLSHSIDDLIHNGDKGDEMHARKQVDDASASEDFDVSTDRINGADKITLSDLFKLRDAELDGMDLDNISEEEFSFD